MTPNELLTIAAAACERLGIRYYATGSMASSYYGEPRNTRDVDVVVALSPDQADSLCAEFSSPDWYVSEDAARDAVRRRGMFNVLRPDANLKIDFVVVKDTPLERSTLARARAITTTAGTQVQMISPEDLILNKLLFFKEGESDKHLHDIGGMLRQMGAEMDFRYLGEWVGRLELEPEWEQAQRARPPNDRAR